MLVDLRAAAPAHNKPTRHPFCTGASGLAQRRTSNGVPTKSAIDVTTEVRLMIA
jgi:hypothetical protein